LSCQTQEQYEEAITTYWQLLDCSHVLEAVIDEDNMISDIVLPIDKTLTDSEKIEILSQLQRNVFLFLKYLALKNLATLFHNYKHNYQEACNYYSNALMIDDTDSTVWYNFAMCAFEMHDYGLARIALEHTLKGSPKHWLAWQMLLKVLYIIGDYYSCSWIAQKLLSKDPSNEEAQTIFYKCSDPAISIPTEHVHIVEQVNEQLQCDVLQMKSHNITWDTLCRRLLAKYDKRVKNQQFLNGKIYVMQHEEEEEEEESDQQHSTDDMSDEEIAVPEEEQAEQQQQPEQQVTLEQNDIHIESNNNNNNTLEEQQQQSDHDIVVVVVEEEDEQVLNPYEQERLKKIEKHKQRLAELGLNANKIGAISSESDQVINKQKKTTTAARKRKRSETEVKRRNPKRTRQTISSKNSDNNSKKTSNSKATNTLSEALSSVLVLSEEDESLIQQQQQQQQEQQQEPDPMQVEDDKDNFPLLPLDDGTLEFIEQMNRGVLGSDERVGSGLIDWIVALLERLCVLFANYRWSVAMRHNALKMYDKIILHNYTLSPKCILTLIELAYAQSQQSNPISEQHLKKSFVTARKLLSKFNIDFICARRSPSYTTIEGMFPMIEDRVRLNWLASLIQYTSNNSEESRMALFECKRLLLLLEDNNNQQTSNYSVTLQNLSRDSLVSIQLVEEKLKEFDIDTKMDEALSLANNSRTMDQSIQIFNRDLFEKAKNDHVRNKIQRTLYEIIQIQVKKNMYAQQQGIDTISMVEFLLRDMDEPFIRNNEKLVRYLLKFFCNVVVDNTKLDTVPIPLRITTVKWLLRALDYFQNHKEDKDYSLHVVRCCILIYRIGLFKNKSDQYSLLPYSRHIYLHLFKAKKRSKLLFDFLIEELYKWYTTSDDSKFEDVRKELYNTFNIYYGVKLTTDQRMYQQQQQQQQQQHESHDYALLSNNREHSYIAFKLIYPEAIQSLTANQHIRREIEKILSLIYNSFRELPQECESIRSQIYDTIDHFDNDSSTNVEDIHVEYSAENNKYIDLYQNIHYLLGQYISKNTSVIMNEVMPAILGSISDSGASQGAKLFAQGVYFLERSLICDPQNGTVWSTLGEKYKILFECMMDVEDMTNEHDNILKHEEVRKHLRLQTNNNFMSDMITIAKRAIQCLRIGYHMNPDDIPTLHRLGHLLFSCLKVVSIQQELSKHVLANLAIKYLRDGCDKTPKEWRYPLMLGLTLRDNRDDNEQQSKKEYAKHFLDLLKKSVELCAAKKSDEKYQVLVLYHLQNSRLKLLKTDENEYGQLVFTDYMYDLKSTKSSGGGSSSSSKKPVTFYDHCPSSSDALEFAHDLRGVMYSNLSAWANVVDGFIGCLRLQNYHHKSLYRLCDCLMYGPWRDWNKTEYLMSAVLRKRASTHSEKPPAFDYKLWIDDADLMNRKQYSYRKWKERCTNLYITSFKHTHNLEACSIVCCGFRRKYLDSDIFLAGSARYALQMFAKIALDKLGSVPDAERQKDTLRYLCEVFVYTHDPEWDKDEKILSLRDVLRSAILSCSGFTVFDPQSKKNEVAQATDFVHSTYKVDVSLTKGNKSRKKAATAGTVNMPKKKGTTATTQKNNSTPAPVTTTEKQFTFIQVQPNNESTKPPPPPPQVRRVIPPPTLPPPITTTHMMHHYPTNLMFNVTPMSPFFGYTTPTNTNTNTPTQNNIVQISPLFTPLPYNTPSVMEQVSVIELSSDEDANNNNNK
jgi:tetratricopeptide (TPR) repeat protein